MSLSLFNLVHRACAQLENFLGGSEAYRARVTACVVPCIGQLAVATRESSAWKNINHLVCVKTNHSSPKVRTLDFIYVGYCIHFSPKVRTLEFIYAYYCIHSSPKVRTLEFSYVYYYIQSSPKVRTLGFIYVYYCIHSSLKVRILEFI